MEIYETSAGVSQGLTELSTTLLGPDLKTVLQASVRPIIQINVLPGLLIPEPASTDEKRSDISKIMENCFP